MALQGDLPSFAVTCSCVSFGDAAVWLPAEEGPFPSYGHHPGLTAWFCSFIPSDLEKSFTSLSDVSFLLVCKFRNRTERAGWTPGRFMPRAGDTMPPNGCGGQACTSQQGPPPRPAPCPPPHKLGRQMLTRPSTGNTPACFPRLGGGGCRCLQNQLFCNLFVRNLLSKSCSSKFNK